MFHITVSSSRKWKANIRFVGNYDFILEYETFLNL